MADVRAEDVEARVQRVGAEEQLRDEILLGFEELAGSVHSIDQAMLDGGVGVDALLDDCVGVLAGAVLIHADDGVGECGE